MKNSSTVLIFTTFLIVLSSVITILCPKDERIVEAFEDILQRVPLPNFGANGSLIKDTEVLSTKIKAGSLYSPIICRPKEHYGLNYSGRCTNELYPNRTSPYGKGEMASPCKPSIEADYYAQRPILNANVYENMLETLLNFIKEKIPKKFIEREGGFLENIKYPVEFCPDDCYTKVMKYIMKKINNGKDELQIFKNYAKNDTWGGEQFAFWNEKVYIFTKYSENNLSQQERAEIARYNKTKGEPRKYIVSFTLHNTLRSSSIDIIATVYELENKMYLTNINFATKKNLGGPDGYNIDNTKGGIDNNNNSLPVPETPQWIFGNTVENKTFNVHGFHDPEPKNNITIPGGYPEEFENYLNNHEQAYLLKGGSAQRLKGGYDGNVVYPNINAKGGNRQDKWIIQH